MGLQIGYPQVTVGRETLSQTARGLCFWLSPCPGEQQSEGRPQRRGRATGQAVSVGNVGFERCCGPTVGEIS